jgi:hypothetical protein
MSASVRRSGRVAAQETVKRVEADLLKHIKELDTLTKLDVLKTQMEKGMFPKTKAVKKALDEKKEQLEREQEDDVTSPSEMAEQGKRLRRERAKLGATLNKNRISFGTRRRKKSRARMNMNAKAAARQAAENAELDAALEAEAARMEAANAAAARDPVMSNLANRFGRASLGPVNRAAHGTHSRKGVPGYHFNAMGGSRRRKRAGKGRSRRSRR